MTTCTDAGEVRWWEWAIDPLTRQVHIPESDAEDIRQLIRSAAANGGIVGHNSKFDAGMVEAAGLGPWPWAACDDTLVASHLLNSNTEHNLTDLAIDWLGEDIHPYENRLKEAVMECRRRVQQARQSRKRKPPDTSTSAGRKRAAEIARDDPLADWRIAEEGLREMPSAGKEPWKADGWLPRAMAAFDKLSGDHPYWTVLSDYANADSETTVRLWFEQKVEIVRRGLMPLYRERLKALPVLAAMERRGVTVDRVALRRMKTELKAEADAVERELVGIALSHGYPLSLPKAGRNGSLDGFVFGTVTIRCSVCGAEQELPGHQLDYCRQMESQGRPCLKCREAGQTTPGFPKVVGVSGLCLPPVYNPKAKTAKPCFDAKIAIPWYLDNLPEGSAGHQFVKGYEKRSGRLKAVDYLETYETFGIPLVEYDGWLSLHPHFHATGTSLLRRSCSNPNLQQVGKKKETNLRRCFGPAPGREWWSFDYKNLELRLPAYESGEADLIALFERCDDPPFFGSEHLLNFSVVYPEIWTAELPHQMKDPEHVKKKYKDTYYQWVKNGDFALNYGAVNKEDGTGTADRTFRRAGSQSRLEARFAKKSALNQKQIDHARRAGYVETILDASLDWGTDPPRGYPLLVTRVDHGYGYGDVLPTTPLNFHIQGSAAWCTLKAMNRIAPKLSEWTAADPRGYHLIIEVHDELVFDFPAGEGPEPWRTNHAKAMEIAQMMEMSGNDLGIPLPVDTEFHQKSWAEGLTVTESMALQPIQKEKLDAADGQKKQRPAVRLVRREPVRPAGPRLVSRAAIRSG